MFRVPPRAVLVFALVLALAPAFARLSAAQGGLVGEPPAADCTGPAPTADEIVSALAADAGPADAAIFPFAGVAESDLPNGKPADPADVDAASAAVWAAIACLN